MTAKPSNPDRFATVMTVLFMLAIGIDLTIIWLWPPL